MLRSWLSSCLTFGLPRLVPFLMCEVTCTFSPCMTWHSHDIPIRRFILEHSKKVWLPVASLTGYEPNAIRVVSCHGKWQIEVAPTLDRWRDQSILVNKGGWWDEVEIPTPCRSTSCSWWWISGFRSCKSTWSLCEEGGQGSWSNGSYKIEVSDRDREYRSRSAERGVEGRGRGQMDSTKSTSFRTPPSSWTGPTAAEKIAKDDVQTTVETREADVRVFQGREFQAKARTWRTEEIPEWETFECKLVGDWSGEWEGLFYATSTTSEGKRTDWKEGGSSLDTQWNSSPIRPSTGARRVGDLWDRGDQPSNAMAGTWTFTSSPTRRSW